MSRSALFVTTVDITLEAFLVPFADRFRADGWRVDAASCGATANPRIADHFDARFDIDWSRNPLDPRNLLVGARQVREIVERGGYDIVHVHTPIAAFATRFALRKLRPRPTVIYTAHGFHFYAGQDALPHALFRTMERLAAPWTDFLVTVNREDFAAAQALGGLAPDRIRYIPGIGVDPERFSPTAASAEDVACLRAGIGVPDDAFLLTMVAEFSRVKRHAHALDALARVRSSRVELALVGDGPLEAEVREAVAAKQLGERVVFAGYRRDLPALLVASDALLLVSEREGLNRSVLEAMAAARAVIGTNTRGIADAVDGAGWIVGKNDVVGLAAAIDGAAENPAGCVRRGALGRERVLAEFSLEAVLEAYERLYGEALATHV